MKKKGDIASHVPTRLPIDSDDTTAFFRRLINYSFAVGRLNRAGGGVADIEEAIRTAKDMQDKRGLEHKVGMSSNVEFAPVSVSEPLTGKKFELGRLPEPTARVAEPIAQAAADIGPYFTPAAPLFAARDIVAGLKHGDPTELATAAFGAPGKYAKAALVGASALMPDEAQATFISEAAKLTPAMRKALAAARKSMDVERPALSWAEHGWAPDPSGKMVSEISDYAARLNPEGLAKFRSGREVKLGDIMSHPDLYDLYPTSSQVTVSPFNRDPRERGFYNYLQDKIGSNVGLSDRDLLENLLHEHQHRVQHIEQMSPGTSPDVFPKPEHAARVYLEERDAMQGALELQRILAENPGMKPIDALMVAKERNVPIANGAFNHLGTPSEELTAMRDRVAEQAKKVMESTPDPYDQYFRSLGEWTARLPGERLEMTEGQRRAAYPFPENFSAIVRPKSPHAIENVESPEWQSGRESAVDLARRLQQEPLPRHPEVDQFDADVQEHGLLEAIRRQREATGKDKGGAIIGRAIQALGKLKPAGSGYAPAAGFPETVSLPKFGKVEARPIEAIEDVAQKYRASRGLTEDRPIRAINPEFSSRVAQAYEDMPHDPRDPAVRRAYDALAEETLAQYRAAKDLGLDIKFLKPGEKDPYAASPALGYEDIVNRGRLVVFPTEQGFGSSGGLNASNVLLKGAGKVGDKEDAVVNDAFRVIHDLYGHFGPGNPFFRAPGEERAYQLHSRMFSPEARPALTSETRGQNSWVNYGPMAERNRAATGETTHYADQKTGLMPDWTMAEPPAEGTDIDAYIRSLRGREDGGAVEDFDKGGVVKQALEAIAKHIPVTDRMAVMHGINPRFVGKVKDMGAFVSPSLAIGKPIHDPVSEFGDIVLVGRKHLAEPGKDNPIFSQDVWTPRFPRTENYNHKDFKGEGFFSSLHGKDVPATIENVLQEMKRRPLVGGEYRTNSFDEPEPNFGYLVGSSAKIFKTPEEIIEARDRLMPKASANRNYNNASLTHANLAFELGEHRPSFDDLENLDDKDYFTKALLNNNLRAYYKKLPDELHERVQAHKESLQNLPSAYFEAKPQRVVKPEEFAGAVVPEIKGSLSHERIYNNAIKDLRDMGISNIVRYSGAVPKPGTTILESFPEHHFDEGGEVKGPGIVDKALGFLSNLNPVGTAQAETLPGALVKAVTKGVKKLPVKAAEEPLFDFSRLSERPNVAQFDLPRYAPARGVPARVNELSENKAVMDKMMEIVGTGRQMGADKWYNTEPLREKFIEQLGESAGPEAYRKYMDIVAATSPRSDVGTNIRNASYYYGKLMRGEPLPAIGEKNPQPYGHMAQKLHQGNVLNIAGAGWDAFKNPKPASFVEGLVGNWEPVAVDTHAFRLPAILSEDPRFLARSYKPEKGATPINFQKMLESGEKSMQELVATPVAWEAVPKDTEYGAMEQLYKKIARESGVTPAQAQAAAWIGGGKVTGLKSAESEPFLGFFQDRIYRTARETGMDPKDVMNKFIKGEIPLYADGGSVTDAALDVVSNLPQMAEAETSA